MSERIGLRYGKVGELPAECPAMSDEILGALEGKRGSGMRRPHRQMEVRLLPSQHVTQVAKSILVVS